jgi:hypothetical protein
MSRKAKALGFAAAIAGAFIPAATLAQNDPKTATREKMTVPDKSGHLFLHREGHRVSACTEDNHLFVTFIFVRAHHSTMNNPEKPIPLKRYLSGLEKEIKSNVGLTQSGSFLPIEEINEPGGMDPGVDAAMELYNRKFNKENKTYMSWVYKDFSISPTPHRICLLASQPGNR